MEVRDVIIIGSGPAGYTAAIYAARAELKPLMIEGPQTGGQLMWTTEVENYPGFPEGIQGPELMQLFRKQAERFGCDFVSGIVSEVDFSAQPFKVKVGDEEYQAKSVIISTGAEARWLGAPGEDDYKGKGVSACATCDGFFFKDKKLVVVGGGDSAMEEATFLSRFASEITVLVRKDEVRASEIMERRAENDPKISFVFNSDVKEVVGDGVKMTGVKILNNKTNEESEIAADGMFVAIGRKPSTEFLNDQIELAKGYIKTKDDSTATNVEGVFAAGDVADWNYRQAITAAGEGCQAAIDVKKYLDEQE
jgi:thioredoxin reductase (NADPH)